MKRIVFFILLLMETFSQSSLAGDQGPRCLKLYLNTAAQNDYAPWSGTKETIQDIKNSWHGEISRDHLILYASTLPFRCGDDIYQMLWNFWSPQRKKARNPFQETLTLLTLLDSLAFEVSKEMNPNVTVENYADEIQRGYWEHLDKWTLEKFPAYQKLVGSSTFQKLMNGQSIDSPYFLELTHEMILEYLYGNFFCKKGAMEAGGIIKNFEPIVSSELTNLFHHLDRFKY